MDVEEALGGKDDEHHGGQLASAGGDFEGDRQGWNSGQWESHPQPQGKASPLWEPSPKIFWLVGRPCETKSRNIKIHHESFMLPYPSIQMQFPCQPGLIHGFK